MSSSNTQAVIVVAVIFAVAIGTILYINFASSQSTLASSSASSRRFLFEKKNPYEPINKSSQDSISYYNEERKSIIDCENMEPKELDGPRFLGSIPNVTVSKGQSVSMSAVLENLGRFKLAFIKLKTQAILSIQDHLITRNPRFNSSIESKVLETQCKNRILRTSIVMYTLHINSVQEEDEGYYMCQVNTDPMTGQWGYLKVESDEEQATTITNVNDNE